LIGKIKEDLETSWGKIGSQLVDKRMDDLGLKTDDDITFREVEMVIMMLRNYTFPLFLDKLKTAQKTRKYMRWLNLEKRSYSTIRA